MQNANPENFVGWDSNLHNGREGNQGSRNDDCPDTHYILVKILRSQYLDPLIGFQINDPF